MGWLVPDALFPESADQRRHAQLVALFSLFTFALTLPLVLVQAVFGSPQVMVIASCGVLPLGVIVILRLTRSVVLAANVLVTLYAAAITAVTIVRGGYGAPIVMALAVVPMLALALAGRRSGTAWLVVTLAILSLIGVLQRTVGLPRVPLADPVATNWLGHMVFVAATYVLMAVYIHLRKRAMLDQQAAEEQLWESERRRMASETEAQLLRSSRMAELGTLAAGVAHEINNPLCYIQGNVEYLLRQGEAVDPADVERIYEEIHTGARHIARIVRDIGTFSRVEEEGEVEVLDVRAALDASINLLWNQLRHRATLRRDYGEVPLVSGSGSRLGQVFVNVLTNALQALPGEGTDEGRIEIRVRPGSGPKPSVVVEIEDNGRGVPPEVSGRVFEPFFTTKPVGEGTGLGLSICYGIVSKLGGQIRLRSTVGAGTTVTIELPVAPGEPSVPSVERAPDEQPAAVKVLIIDDDKLVARSTARLLERHEVTVVTSARDALAELERGTFDVVLCDLMMPGMTGMQLHEKLERLDRNLARRVIFVTGGAFTAEAREFLERTGNPCLQKPLGTTALEEEIQRAVAR